MAESKSLKFATEEAVKKATKEANTGNVTTSKAPPKSSDADLPTGARSHPPA